MGSNLLSLRCRKDGFSELMDFGFKAPAQKTIFSRPSDRLITGFFEVIMRSVG
jgi:hypothetical protein